MATASEIFRTTITYTIPNASAAQNVFWFSLANADALDSDVGDAIDGWIQGDFAPTWSNLASENCELVSHLVQCVNDDGSIKRDIGVYAVGEGGAIGGESESAAVSGFFFAPTSAPKVRGRKFIPGLSPGLIVNGALDLTGLSLLAALADLYLDTIPTLGGTGATLIPGVLSTAVNLFRYFGDTVLATDIPAYQRRRKPGVGS